MNEKAGDILERFTKDRSNLLPILQEFQESEKYLSSDAITEISHYLDISENDIYSVASFYPRFLFTHPADHTIEVCLCTSCHLRGGERILEIIENELNIKAGQITDDLKFSLETVTRSGCTASAPLVLIDQDVYCRMSPVKIKEVLARYN